ncbi:MAG: FtsH protease activity modulator HflK [Candidatus Omnitrophota bacterium]|nr:MAG: FtsH protease activity modulator HflK [Candidatus Omnitrophota bacterium]
MEFERRSPDEIIEPFKKKFNSKFLKSGPLVAVAILVISVILGGTFYTIQPNEVGLVLRFGKFIRSTKPGLHLKIPLGIEKAFPVKVEYIYKDEFGFRTRAPGIRSTYEARSYDEESLMLTGDLNVLDLEWIVQFKIKDPFKALFVVRNVRKTLRDLSEAVMRQIAGNYTFTEVLTTKRIEVNIAVQKKLQEILDSYNSGIQIVTVKLQDVNPPDPVKPAFNEVNEAKQEREKLINQAWETYNQKIPQARGEALKMVTEAEGYALAKINTAQGDAKRFLLLQKEYARAKNVTRRRLYLENMSEILKKAKSKYIVDPEQKGILPLLQLKK